MNKVIIKNEEIKDKTRIFLLYFLTLSRIFFAITFFLILIKINKNDIFILNLIAFFCVLLMELTDVLDGYIARKYNLVTFIGSIIDPFSDSISRLIVFGTIAYKGLCLPFVPIIMVLRDLTIAYTRIALNIYSIDYSTRFSGKLKGFIQGISALVLISLLIFNIDLSFKNKIVIFFSYLITLIVLYSLFDYTLGAFIKYKNLTIKNKNI